MDELSDIWIEQCEAAREIRDAWGTRKALEYLVGEKFLNHVRASDSDPSWAAKLPLFAEEIRQLFTSVVANIVPCLKARIAEVDLTSGRAVCGSRTLYTR